MRHTPGKRNPIVKRASGHSMTRAKIAAAALDLQARGKILSAMQFWNHLEVQQAREPMNQRQRRKHRRQRWASGDRFAFAK